MTVEPYAIANNLPYDLAASFEIFAQNPPELASEASNFFFTGGTILQSDRAAGVGARSHPTDGQCAALELFPANGTGAAHRRPIGRTTTTTPSGR